MFDAEHERIKEILEKNASTRDYKIIPVNEDNLTHVFRITEALERKEYVCFQGDRYLNKEKLLSSPFMGKEAEFPMGPFLLASKMRVPVVFYFAMREAKKTIVSISLLPRRWYIPKRSGSNKHYWSNIHKRWKNHPAVSGTMVQLLPVLGINTNLDYDA